MTSTFSIWEPDIFAKSTLFFLPSTKTLTLPFPLNCISSGYLSVKVFNISGQLVDVIASGVYSPNSYDFTWNANNMATGMYVINAESWVRNLYWGRWYR